MGRFLPTMPLVSLVTTSTVVVLVGVLAHGQIFRHFDIKADIAKTASKPVPPVSDMAARAADKQAALQVGRCASLWNKQLSKQCPPGSFMAMKERSTTEGLMAASIFRCQAAGCLHALEAGEEEEEDAPRDKGATLKAAVTREVHKLVEEQPGKSFDEHLTTMRKRYVEGGLEVKTMLKTLLREASPERERTSSSCTTMWFFAELARYRGFVGPEIDEAWAFLHEVHKKEMALAFFRRAPQLLTGRLGRTIVTVGLDANAKAQTIRHQDETIATLQTELTAALDRERMAEEEAAAAAAPVSGLFAVLESERIAHEKRAALVSELLQVKQLLAEERDAKETAVVAVEEAARAEVATIRAKVKAAQLATVKKLTSLHASEVSAALAEKRAAVKKAAGLEQELSEVKNLLDKGRIEIAAVRGEAKADQLAAEKKASLHASEISTALARERAAVKKVARLERELSEVKKLQDKGRIEIANVRGEAKAAQLAAEKKASLHASEISTALARERAAVKKAAGLERELSEAKKLLDKGRIEIANVRGEAKAAQLAAEKKVSLHASEISTALARERAAVKKVAGLERELSEVKKLLDKGRIEIANVRGEAKAAQLTAEKEASLHASDISTALARERAAVKKVAGLERELSEVKKLLDKGRIEIANVRGEAKAAQLTAEKEASLHVSEVSTALAGKRAAAKKTADLTSELFHVKQLLDKKRAEIVAVRGEALAAQLVAENKVSLHVSEVSIALAGKRAASKKAADLTSELFHVKQLLDKQRAEIVAVRGEAIAAQRTAKKAADLASELFHVKQVLDKQRAETIAVRGEAIATQLTAEKKTSLHASEISAALAGKRAAAKKAAELTSDLFQVKQLLDKARAEIIAVRGEAIAAQLTAEKKASLHASEVSSALAGMRVAAKKAVALESELSEAKKLLAEELSAGAKAEAKAAEAEEAARAEVVAVRIEAKAAQLATEKMAFELSEANTLLEKERNAKEKCDDDTDLFVAMALFEAQEREGAAFAKVAGLESELSIAKKALGKERNATARAVLAEVAVRAELSALRVATRAAQQAAEKHTTLLEPELCADMEREEALDKKAACLASELAQAKKLLEEERSVMEMALTAEHELRAEISALRRETGDSQQTTAERNTSVLESEICADTERQKVIHEEKEAQLVSELSLAKQLLEEERGVMEMVLVADDEMRAEISTLRRETGEAQQAAAENTARLESRLSAALKRELVAIEKVANLAAGLSLVKQLLDKEPGAGKKWL